MSTTLLVLLLTTAACTGEVGDLPLSGEPHPASADAGGSGDAAAV